MPKCDFNKVARHLKNTYGGLLLYCIPLSFSRRSQENVWKKSATKGNIKAAGCMAANLLKTNFFTCIIKFYKQYKFSLNTVKV